jgi:hypothetical protein
MQKLTDREDCMRISNAKKLRADKHGHDALIYGYQGKLFDNTGYNQPLKHYSIKDTTVEGKIFFPIQERIGKFLTLKFLSTGVKHPDKAVQLVYHNSLWNVRIGTLSGGSGLGAMLSNGTIVK